MPQKGPILGVVSGVIPSAMAHREFFNELEEL
jgi:hypothetical protein